LRRTHPTHPFFHSSCRLVLSRLVLPPRFDPLFSIFPFSVANGVAILSLLFCTRNSFLPFPFFKLTQTDCPLSFFCSFSFPLWARRSRCFASVSHFSPPSETSIFKPGFNFVDFLPSTLLDRITENIHMYPFPAERADAEKLVHHLPTFPLSYSWRRTPVNDAPPAFVAAFIPITCSSMPGTQIGFPPAISRPARTADPPSEIV